jgi:hypothetical protein
VIHTDRIRPRTALAVLLLALLALPGCSFFGGGGPLRIAAENGSTELPASFALAAYVANDSNSADLYFTDLPPEDRLADANRSGVSGQFLHIHLFLDPEAGQTPLDPTACNIVVRHLVIAGNELGLYGGGGFMPLSGTPGDDSLGGNVLAATLRLIGATPAFDDRLGNCELSGNVSAPKNEAMAKELARSFDDLARRIPGVK